MQNVVVVTVYITPEMYHAFFSANPYLEGCAVLGVDNRVLNRGLPVVYNEIIEGYLEQECWLFFMHEDLEVKSCLDVVYSLDKAYIYGTFGVDLQSNVPVAYGRHTCSDKDGSNAVDAGLVVNEATKVQTLDCQTLLVHTSLLAKYPQLRFDEKLSFDLYTEDFCINARVRYGIEARVFPLKFQHYSHGNITQRYHDGLRYLAKKYPGVGVPGSCSFIGGRASELEEHFTYDIRADRGNAGAARKFHRMLEAKRRARAIIARWRNLLNLGS